MDAVWTSEKVEQFINSIRTISIATTDRLRGVHIAPTIAMCWQGSIFCTVSPRSRMLGNVRSAPDVAFSVTGTASSVFGQAKLTLREYEAGTDWIALAEQETGGRFAPPDWVGYVGTLEITRIFAV